MFAIASFLIHYPRTAKSARIFWLPEIIHRGILIQKLTNPCVAFNSVFIGQRAFVRLVGNPVFDAQAAQFLTDSAHVLAIVIVVGVDPDDSTRIALYIWIWPCGRNFTNEPWSPPQEQKESDRERKRKTLLGEKKEGDIVRDVW
jgi:hypothetical protein